MSYWNPRRSLCAFTGLALTAVSLAVSCGGDDRPPPASSSSGGRDSDDGEGGAGPTGSGGEGGTADVPGAPSVELQAPEEDEVLTGTLDAACVVLSDDAPSASPINPASVVVQLLDDDGAVVGEGPATVAGADEYTVALALAEVPSGLYTVTCSASDTAIPPLTGTDEVSVLVDHGPAIEAVNPLPDGYLARAGLHDFEVKIRPVPLFPGDDDAELVGDPILTVDHQEFTLVPKDGDEPDVYIVEGIDFEDTDLFPEPPPDQTAVVVTAENGRAVSGRLDYNVAVDGTGPEIAILQPLAATIIGSRVTFVLQIVDDFSGVDWDSLVVEAKDISIPFDLASSRWTLSGNVATLEINTGDYSVATQLSINVTVADVAGNLSSNGAGSTYYLDQQPPILSLDPPNIRLLNATTSECSYAFDPVGPLAVNYGGDTNNLVMFRAFAWDITNEEPGQVLFHYSTVDPASIRLWVARADQALIVDTPGPDETSGDGVCDAISSAADADVDAVEMFGLGVGGGVYFGDGITPEDLPDPAMDGICAYPAAASTVPVGLCGGLSDLTYAVGQKFDTGAVPAVYAPLVGAGASCAGDQQSVGALLGDYEGWVCAAVTGQDYAGNTSISEAIAFCLDNPEVDDEPDCLGDGPGAAPNCAEACTPRTFAPGGIIVDPNWGG